MKKLGIYIGNNKLTNLNYGNRKENYGGFVYQWFSD